MFDANDKKRINAGILFLICALVGAVCFVGIYGHRILDPSNIGWLFDNDHDLRQHFFGWCAFRRDPWHFPIGLIDSLSYPDSISVIYTDSIPMFAVFFKLIQGILPVDFQYFGLFGILSFALMGGFASLLLRRIVASDAACIIGSVFYVISAPVIQRMYFHTALAAQWIIVAALALWLYDGILRTDRVKIICWALISFVCVGIHSYFLPMTAMILAADMITQFVKKKDIYLPVMEFLAFCAAGLANLYILGAFYGNTSAAGFGLGTFTSNLNTFINPWEIGHILPVLPLQNYFQYEGMAYLGAGILLLFVIVAAGLVIRAVRKVPEEAFHTRAVYGRITIVLAAVSFIAAVVPNISYNDRMLLWVPYPRVVEDVLSIFRSNGRLVWPAMYILITAAISFTAHTFRRYNRILTVIIAAALILQISDMSVAFSDRYRFYMSGHSAGTVWDDPDVSAFTDGADEFIFMYTENDITLQTAYYGYIHNIRQNNFYFARDVSAKVSSVIDLYRSELENNNLRDKAVYIVKEEDYDKEKEFYDGLDADMMHAFGHVIFKAKPDQNE